MTKEPIDEYWTRPLSEAIELESTNIGLEDAERHKIFSLLALALLADAFNGNKKGATGNYPFRQAQKIGPDRYAGDAMGDRYLGHNIASFAVDARGEIIDFEFNHNEIFNSSVEHAEARLIRRIFSMTQGFDRWETATANDMIDVPYGTVLSAVTVYTTLESCAQCSGIMTLGNVKNVVYLQRDPGQYWIGNIMYNLSNPLSFAKPKTYPNTDPTKKLKKYFAPEPVSGDLFAFAQKAKLETAFDAFTKSDPETPFYENGAYKDKSRSITSFLCTDAAKAIFDEAARELEGLKLSHGSYAPTLDPKIRPALTNAEVLQQATLFRPYACRRARRGTPHK